MLWIATALLWFSLKRQADRSEKKFALLQSIDCSRALDVIDKELGCMCLKWSTADRIDQSNEKIITRSILSMGGLS